MAQQRQHAQRRRLPLRRSGTAYPARPHLYQLPLTKAHQFSIALFVFIDAATFSHSPLNGSDVHMNFVDWIPGIICTLGMLIINLIDKSRLSADSFSHSGDGVAWKARVVLFMGFAMMAGGLAGGVTVCVLKYVVPETTWPTLWFGVANVVANALIMLRYVLGCELAVRSDADEIVARLFSGSARTWRMITLTTWPCRYIRCKFWLSYP